jgi:rhodanese-related sulfurtransferase
MKKIILLLCITMTAMAATAQNAVVPVVSHYTAERFNIIMKQEGVLIDLRTPEEVKKGYIPGATFIDYLAKDAHAQIDKLDKNKTYYIYCESGGRSSEAAAYMEQHGFKRVYTLEKGYFDWQKKGFPTEVK